MRDFIEPEWLIAGEPREVQLEALRRSYYGYRMRENKNDEGNPVQIRDGFAPAIGYGHLLEMRLGKTPLILNEFALFERDWSFRKLIVFTPNSYKEDWAEEALKYGLNVPMLAYHQTRIKDAREFVRKANGSFGLAVNYESLQYDVTLEFLSEIIGPDTYVASDESIKIKNPKSLFSKGAMLVTKEAGIKRIATGLPMTQGPHDFYQQGRFIGMYDGYNYYAFRGRFCQMGGFKNKQVKGAKNEDQLNEQINANAFVAKRKDWGNLRDATYYNVRLAMDPKQKKYYDEIDNDFITWLEDGTEISVDQVISKMLKLAQISSGFMYTETGEAVEIMDPRKTPKMLRLLEMLETEVDGKVVVPFHYAKSGDLLLDVLAKYNPATIRGQQWMKKNERDIIAEKARFNNSKECRLILLQMQAGKYGHDLSGNENDRCQTTIFFENSYSLDDRGQIEMRNTTAFQDWDNIYLDFFCSKVEANAIKALVKKENMVESILGAYREGKERRDYGT